MRIETKVYTVYKYDELPENVQQKVLQELWDINLDYEWWDFDGLTGFSEQEIKKHHLKPSEWRHDLLTYKKMYFDIDRGQYIQFVDCHFTDGETARKFLGVPKKLWDNTYWSFVNNREFTTRLEYECQDNYKDFTDKQKIILDRAVERFSDKMQEAWRILRDTYEYNASEEAIVETIHCNDYEFTEDGKIAR